MITHMAPAVHTSALPERTASRLLIEGGAGAFGWSTGKAEHQIISGARSRDKIAEKMNNCRLSYQRLCGSQKSKDVDRFDLQRRNKKYH